MPLQGFCSVFRNEAPLILTLRRLGSERARLINCEGMERHFGQPKKISCFFGPGADLAGYGRTGNGRHVQTPSVRFLDRPQVP